MKFFQLDTTEKVMFILVSIGAVFTELFGPVDLAWRVLLIVMGLDIVSGLVSAAKRGVLSPREMFFGLLKKGVMLCLVCLAFQMDRLFGTDKARQGCIAALILNEALSFIENALELNIRIPLMLKRMLEAWQQTVGEVVESRASTGPGRTDQSSNGARGP